MSAASRAGRMFGGSGVWVVLAGAALTSVVAGEIVDDTTNSTNTLENNTFDEHVKQVVWKKCALQLTPTCLKLTLARLVDRLSQDTLYQPLPGVTLSSNRSKAVLEPPASSSRGDLGLAERLDEYLRHRVNSYFNSLTLSVKPFELPVLNATGVLESVVDNVTGRKKDGGVGAGALALMMGGAMMAMMMSMLAALAGKAMMASMLALMMSAMSAMKGGDHGGGKSTTYEIYAQPHHSDHHGWRRSADSPPPPPPLSLPLALLSSPS